MNFAPALVREGENEWLSGLWQAHADVFRASSPDKGAAANRLNPTLLMQREFGSLPLSQLKASRAQSFGFVLLEFKNPDERALKATCCEKVDFHE